MLVPLEPPRRDVRFAEDGDIAKVGEIIKFTRSSIDKTNKLSGMAAGQLMQVESMFKRGDYVEAAKKAKETLRLISEITDELHDTFGSFGKGHFLPEKIFQLTK